MCGRFTLTAPERIHARYPLYRFEEFSEYRLPRFNVAPAQGVLGVVNDGTDRVDVLNWGIDGRINARAETVAARPVAFRCIIFSDGFYEWRGRKPFYYTLEDDRVFAFAGVWRPGNTRGCAIITCPANVLVAQVHDRMPVILADDALERWLAPRDMNPTDARSLLVPYDADAMQSQTASMRLNDARYDSADVLDDNDPVQESFFEN